MAPRCAPPRQDPTGCGPDPPFHLDRFSPAGTKLRESRAVNVMVTISTQGAAVAGIIISRLRAWLAPRLARRHAPRSNGIWPLIGLALVALLASAIVITSLTSRMDVQASAEKRMMMVGALRHEV